jgi:hypothetical protein
MTDTNDQGLKPTLDAIKALETAHEQALQTVLTARQNLAGAMALFHTVKDRLDEVRSQLPSGIATPSNP